MRSSRKATRVAATTSEGCFKELHRDIKALRSLPDEIKSIRDLLRSLERKVIVMEFQSAKNFEFDAVKTELRLIRSDLSALENKLAPVEAKLPA